MVAGYAVIWELVGSGSVLDADEIAVYEGYVQEGSRGAIEFDLRVGVPAWLVRELENRLHQVGVTEVRVFTTDSVLSIEYRKGVPWAAVIVAAVLGLIALAIIIISWRFFREVIEVIPEPLRPMAGVAVIAGLVLLGLAAFGASRKAIAEGKG